MGNSGHKILTSGKIDDEELWGHFRALGVGSVSGYKLWCHRHGLSTDLEKRSSQRLAEIELFDSLQPVVDPDLSRDHDPRRAAQFVRIFRGELQDEPLSDVPSRVRKLYRALEGEEEARWALGRLVLHVEKYSRFFRPMPIFGRWGHSMANTCIGGLEQLARHHGDWCRPVEEWRPEGNKQRFQFSSLVRHLLARYEVPLVMDSAWFQGNSPEARQQQEWFKHVGFGQNIRTAGVPMAITKRMAHLFLQENNRHSTLIQALRRVQVEALGGNMHIAWAVAGSPLGRSFENEDFWRTVVHFFVNNHPMLSQTYVDPIYDYIRHQKFEPQRVIGADGQVVEGPPPQLNFGMKGRSADKLLRQVDDWHAQLSGVENMPLKTWEPCGLREFSYREVDAKIGRQVEWTIRELVTSAQLGVEGRTMHHCVGSYADRCMSGGKSIWSMRIVDLEAEEPEPMHVLTIAVDPKRRTVTESRGKYNLKPFDNKRVGKKRRANGLYLRFLRESARIMRLWMDREGLAHG
jgi:hypothetical protein